MICLLGGTFDPVHIGHLRCALDLCAELKLAQVHLLPAQIPPLRELPQASAQQRLDMLRLAIADEKCLTVDARELARQGLSYSVDTLAEIRTEIGDQPLLFCVGADAFAKLQQWHHWESLFDLAHLVVMGRPTSHQPLHPKVAEQLRLRQVTNPADLATHPQGKIYQTQFVGLGVSASEIRAKIARKESARYLVPDLVIAYMQSHHLYQSVVAK